MAKLGHFSTDLNARVVTSTQAHTTSTADALQLHKHVARVAMGTAHVLGSQTSELPAFCSNMQRLGYVVGHTAQQLQVQLTRHHALANEQVHRRAQEAEARAEDRRARCPDACATKTNPRR
jgi:hypothetical protein